MTIVTVTLALAYPDEECDIAKMEEIYQGLTSYAVDRLDASAVGYLLATIRKVGGVDDSMLDSEDESDGGPVDQWLDRANKEVGNG